MGLRGGPYYRTCGLALFLQAFLLVAAILSPSAATAAAQPTTRPYVLHFPGVGGVMPVDRSMLTGLVAGKVNADIQTFDWTERDPGVHALHAYDRNQLEAARAAEFVVARARKYPGERLVLTSHSAGGAMAVWTLEKLPPEVKVDDVLLMAPALSPDYDLTAALRHVRGKMYVFWSSGDCFVLGFGCRLCGTMDGKYTDAAGLLGFSQPVTGDAEQYKKLDQRPYQASWVALGNYGGHVGPMSWRFSAAVLAPLVDSDLR